MLITPQKVEVKWSGGNRKHYESKGYTPYQHHKSFLVNVEDLYEKSTVKVKVLCDYCLKKGKETIIEKKYDVFIKSNHKSIIHKDCCEKCRLKKVEESNLVVYGVKSTK